MKLASNLKLYRQKKHYTQTELANKLHVSRKTISNWENGRSQPSYNMLNELGKIYGISTANLLNGESKKLSKAVFIAYYLNIILLILYYPAVIYGLSLSDHIHLFISLDLIFMIINYKKWYYVIKNKTGLCFILFISFVDLIFNCWFYVTHGIGVRDMTYDGIISYQVVVVQVS